MPLCYITKLLSQVLTLPVVRQGGIDQALSPALQQQQSGKHEGQVASSMQGSHGYLHMLKAMPRSNSMLGHSSFQGASAPMVRPPSRAPSRGR